MKKMIKCSFIYVTTMNNNISYKKDISYLHLTLLKDIFVTYYRKKKQSILDCVQ